MKTVDQILERVETEMLAGRLWRAKEILRGSIATGGVHPRVLERYGQLLDSVGDRVEAGRYLFFSGIRETSYEEPIAIFLGRHSRSSAAMIGRAPKFLLRVPFNDLPPTLQTELADLGIPTTTFGPRRITPAVSASQDWKSQLGIIGCVALGIFAVVAAVVGAITIVVWLVNQLK